MHEGTLLDSIPQDIPKIPQYGNQEIRKQNIGNRR